MESRPYLSRSALIDNLEKDGYTKSQVKKQMDVSNPDGLIGCLVMNEIIEPFDQGWVVIDPALASSMLMRKYQR